MSWYTHARTVLALRKHNLRADLRVYGTDENSDPNNHDEITGRVKGILTSALLQGLDIIGIVTPFGPIAGWLAQQVVVQDDLDIWVIPGEEYLTSDKYKLFVYMLRDPIPPNLTYVQVSELVKRHRGLIMVSELTRRQAQQINKMIGHSHAPDLVEIYNAATGAFQDVDVDLPKVVSSASRNATDLETTNVFTLIPRKDAEALGLLPEDHGKNYVPDYLKPNDDELDAMSTQKNQGGLGKGAKRTPQPFGSIATPPASPLTSVPEKGVNNG